MADIDRIEPYSTPETRLDRLAAAAVDAVAAHSEAAEGDGVIVLVRAPVPGTSDPAEWDTSSSHTDGLSADTAVEWMLAVASAICQVNGRSLQVVRVGRN